MLDYCPKDIVKLLQVSNGKNPCPRKWKGSFKYAHVCEGRGVIYYSSTRSDTKIFQADIEQLKKITEWNPRISRYFMRPLCLLDSIPSTGANTETVLVRTMTSVEKLFDQGEIDDEFVDKFVDFISNFLRDVASTNKEYMYYTTDLKPGNLMIDRHGDFLFSDFSPIKYKNNQIVSFVSTKEYYMASPLLDFVPYMTEEEATRFVRKFFILTAMTTLYSMAYVAKYNGEADVALADLAYTDEKQDFSTLNKCIRYVNTRLREVLRSSTMKKVKNDWIRWTI